VAVGVLAVKTAVLCKVTPTRSHIGVAAYPSTPPLVAVGVSYTNLPVIGLLLVALVLLLRHHGCRTTDGAAAN